jgi:hypothetical protein
LENRTAEELHEKRFSGDEDDDDDDDSLMMMIIHCRCFFLTNPDVEVMSMTWGTFKDIKTIPEC